MTGREITTEVICGVFQSVPTEAEAESRGWPYQLEDPTQPLNDDVIEPGRVSQSGVTISDTSALEIDHVWAAVSLISDDIAKLRLQLHRRDHSGDRSKVVTEHPLNRMLSFQPNDRYSAVDFWAKFMQDCLMWGNGYAWILRDDAGRPEQLVNLIPTNVDPRLVSNGTGGRDLFYQVTVDEPGASVIIPARDVFHVAWVWDWSRWGIMGQVNLHRARNSWGLASAQTKFAADFFANGGKVGGVLNLPVGMGKTARDNLASSFFRVYGGNDSPFRTVVLREGATYTASQHNFRDTQMIESQSMSGRNVAARFKIPPSMMGIQNSTYSSRSEENRAYLDSALSGWLSKITSQADVKLLSRREQATLFFKHDTRKLLRLDPKSQAEVHQIYRTQMVMTANEIRDDLGLPPMEGGDVLVNPNTTSDDDTATEEAPGKDADDAREESRAIFALTYQARAKARRGESAWRGWISSGNGKLRSQMSGAFGSEDVMDLALHDFRKLDPSTADFLERLENQLLALEVDYVPKT